MDWLTDTTVCRHCHREYADHDYVPDSIDVYECPHPQVEAIYGYFHGGDPRNFSPDYECCSEKEITAWKEACNNWEDGKRVLAKAGCCRTVEQDGKVVKLGQSSFGIGMNLHYTHTTFDPVHDDAAELTEWIPFPETCIDCGWSGDGDDTGQCPICGGVCEPAD